MNLRKLFTHSSIYLAGTLATRAVSFLMVPLYSRYLSPANFGIAELLELALMLVSIVFGLQAIGAAMIRTYYDFTDSADRAAVVSTAVIATALGGAVITVAGILCAGPLSLLLFHTEGYARLLVWAFEAMFLSGIASVLVIWFRLTEQPLAFVLYSAGYLVVTLGLNVYWIAYRQRGIEGFVLSKLAASIIGTIVLAGLVLRQTGLRWSPVAFRRMASFGAPQILTGLAFCGIHFSDRFFINAYAGVAEVGLYSLAYKFAFLVTYLIGEPFGRVWGTSVYVDAEHVHWSERTGRVASYFMFALLLGSVAISLFGAAAIRLMTPASYWAAVQYVPVVVMAYAMRESGDFFREILFAERRSTWVSGIATGCAIFNLGANFVLIPRWGAWGAAVSTLFTWMAYLASMWFGATRDRKIPFSPARFSILGGLCGVALYVLWILSASNLYVLSLTGLLLVIGVIASAWFTSYFPAPERTRIAHEVRRLQILMSQGKPTAVV